MSVSLAACACGAFQSTPQISNANMPNKESVLVGFHQSTTDTIISSFTGTGDGASVGAGVGATASLAVKNWDLFYPAMSLLKFLATPPLANAAGSALGGVADITKHTIITDDSKPEPNIIVAFSIKLAKLLCPVFQITNNG